MRCSGGIFDIEAAEAELAALTATSEDPSLWDNPNKAQKLMQEKSYLEQQLSLITDISAALEDNQMLLELAAEEQDDAAKKEAESALFALADKAKQQEIAGLLSGAADRNNCFIEIHSGAGGTESMDWALMLERMYLRWCEKRGFTADIIDEQSGEEAGIKSATLRVKGINAFGWAKTESGVHRLVRLSPFDSANRRHTSFASVWVYPEVDDSIDITIEEKDIRIDTYRASGAGGQHVNTTDSAVRITHIPTNIVVQCQNDRSQHRNKAEALQMLKARLYELELRKQEEAAGIANASKDENGWGSQIRSYVLHPYQMVKDLRTSTETSDTQGVLDGDIDRFINAALAARIGGVNNNTQEAS